MEVFIGLFFGSVVLGGILVIFFPATYKKEEVDVKGNITNAASSLGIDNVYANLLLAKEQIGKCQFVNQAELVAALDDVFKSAQELRQDKTSRITEKLIAAEGLRQAILRIRVQHSQAKNESVQNFGLYLLFGGSIGFIAVMAIYLFLQVLKGA